MDKNGETKYLHITKKFKMMNNPLGKRSEFWDEFLDKYRQMANDGLVVNEEINRTEL